MTKTAKTSKPARSGSTASVVTPAPLPTSPATSPAAIARASRLTSEPISKEFMHRVREKIIFARIELLFEQSFFGRLAMRMQLMPADKWCATMAVDGKYLYYNHQFVDKLRPKELQFVFAHEICHLVYDHLGRRDYRDARLYNIAADYVVNDELIQIGIGEFPTTVSGLHDIKYRDWNSEKVYDDLLEEQNKSGDKSKSIQQLLDKLLDEHLDPASDNSNDDSGEKGSGEGSGEGSGPIDISDEERKQLRAELMDAVINAAKTMTTGSLPLGIDRMVQNLTEPKMDWKALLQCHLDSIIPADYSFLRVSRTGWHTDAIMPGMVNEQLLNVVVALDMSGSIDNELASEFLSEVGGIMSQYPAYEILVMCYDTKIHNPKLFSSDNGESLSDYCVAGGGGTSYEAIYNYLKDNDIVPHKLINLTDGYPTGSWGDELYCPLVTIIKGSKVVPPFGQYAYMD